MQLWLEKIKTAGGSLELHEYPGEINALEIIHRLFAGR
jgi:hypothetical protein